MSLFHSKIRKQGKEGVDENPSLSAIATLTAYRQHIKMTWPELDIEVGFIQGTNGSELCFSHSLGWESKIWAEILAGAILIPLALENCKKGGISKFVFHCNNEAEEHYVYQLLDMVNSWNS